MARTKQPPVEVANRPLTDRQKRFVSEYIIDLNAAAAYRRAGYTAKSDQVASANAARLIAKDSIAAAIVVAQAERAARTEIKADTILRELARIGLSDARKLFRPDGSLLLPAEWDDATAAAVSSVEAREEHEGQGEYRRLVGHVKKVRLWDKVAALAKAGQHLGMFPTKVEMTGKDGTPLLPIEFIEGRAPPAAVEALPPTPEARPDAAAGPSID